MMTGASRNVHPRNRCPPADQHLIGFRHPTTACQTLYFPMLDNLPTNIEATLLRPCLIGANGVPHVELPDDPDSWRDDGDAELVSMGRGVFTVVKADDSAALAQIDGDSEAMAVRARFEPLADCPRPRMGDTIAVEVGLALAITFEVVITGDDFASGLADWGAGAPFPFSSEGPAPGEFLLVLREDVGVVTA